VVYLDPDGKVLDAFSAKACNVTVDPADNTYVANAACGGDGIQVYGPTHELIGSWSGPDMILAAPPQFGPNGEILALDRDGAIVKLKVTLPPA
jgi:sugar lactone lactonase YvrE